MDKSIIYFCQGRLTTAPRLVGFVWHLHASGRRFANDKNGVCVL